MDLKKIFSLLVICLLLTSCGSKKEEQKPQNQEQTQQQEVQEDENVEEPKRVSNVIYKVDEQTSVYSFDDSIPYNGSTVKDVLNTGTSIRDIVEGMAFTSSEDELSHMYIMETDPSFYVMFCGTDSNKNVYVSTNFYEAFEACK